MTNPVPAYLEAFAASGMAPDAFARRAAVYFPSLVSAVLNWIGSWPSSEPALAALQRIAA